MSDRDVAEDGRLDEVAVGQLGRRHPLAAGQQLGAILDRELAVIEDAIPLLRRDHRPHLGLEVERIADADLARLVDERAGEVVVDALVQEETSPGRAALAGIGVDREERAVDRLVDIGVREDDVRALAAQL